MLCFRSPTSQRSRGYFVQAWFITAIRKVQVDILADLYYVPVSKVIVGTLYFLQPKSISKNIESRARNTDINKCLIYVSVS